MSAVVVNAQTTGLSEYSIPALDVAVLDGEVYFLTATGLVKLSGALTGTSSIETGDLMLHPGQVCNVPRVYPDIYAPAPLELLVTASVQGKTHTTSYKIPARTGSETAASTVPLGKGPRGNQWRFKIRGRTSDWSLAGLEVTTVFTGRVR